LIRIEGGGRVDQPGQSVEADLTSPPLGQARVFLEDGEAVSNRTVQLRRDGQQLVAGTTGPDGQYLSPLLPLGQITAVVFNGDGAAAARGELTGEGQVLELRPQASRTGRIKGRVQLADGSPVTRAYISAFNEINNSSSAAFTDEEGSYALEGVSQTGEVEVQLQIYYESGQTFDKYVSLAQSGEDTQVDWILPLGTVRVSVRTPSGEPPDASYNYNVRLVSEEGPATSGSQSADNEFILHPPVPL